MADKENVSLIAVSFTGKSSSSGARVESTVCDVANTATRPVLVIRKEKEPVSR